MTIPVFQVVWKSCIRINASLISERPAQSWLAARAMLETCMAIQRQAGPLTIERLLGLEALAAIAAEWNALERETAPRTPYTSLTYIIPWWQHFARRRQTLFHDEFFCHVVRGDGGRLVAIAPLMRTCAPGIGAPILRMVQFFGTDPGLTEIRGLICRPEDEPRVVNALVEYFLSCPGEWDVFRWAGLR